MIVVRVIVLASLSWWPIAAMAQSRPRTVADAAAENEQLAETSWQAYFRHVAGEYRLTVGQSDQPLPIMDKPVLKWSQPVRGGEDGAVYLWLDRGRPAVVGTFFIWPDKDGRFGNSHELHRLTSSELTGLWRDRIRWRPKEDAMTWQPVPAAAPPDQEPSRRSIQARQIARRFAATSVNRQGEKSELRLQPRPFFQYDGEGGDEWLGGALFSIVHGTDTEVILWLEARPGKDAPAWHFACARMSDLKLQVTLDGKEVWSVDLSQYDQFDSPYLCTTGEFLREPPATAGQINRKPPEP